MSDLVLHTYDWVPPPPRGLVRDIRVRWALEEAGLAYRVAATPFDNRGPEHLAHHPFGQTPWLTDGDLSIFESGAILLHLGGKSPALLPADPARRSEAVQWVFGALNSMEMATVPWSMFHFMNDTGAAMFRFFDDWVGKRLERLEPVLGGREWLAGTFSIADLLMADVLRLVDRFDGLKTAPACKAYMQRATARPAFVKAHADQLAWFAAADAAR
ncbi:MAG: glutathione S-transferase family protein [Pseudomonadota bacterium]